MVFIRFIPIIFIKFIHTYVKNYDKDKNGNSAEMLLYAKTDEIVLPHNTYQMDGNVISVDTLDLKQFVKM